MVEFKHYLPQSLQEALQTRIEPWWNLNSVFTLTLPPPEVTRIEPWWNLNQVVRKEITPEEATRIEPWWNLNYLAGYYLGYLLRLELNHGGI